MPGFNQKGPQNEGSMTGGRRGACNIKKTQKEIAYSRGRCMGRGKSNGGCRFGCRGVGRGFNGTAGGGRGRGMQSEFR